MKKEAKQGKWGLWYVEGSTAGHATKEQAEESLTDTVPQHVPAGAEKEAKSNWGPAKWALAAILAVGAFFWWQSGADERAANARLKAAADAERKTRMAALLSCQKAIRATARYGGADMPPYVPATWNASTLQFIWPEGSFHFKNGFGVSVPQWARCQVDTDKSRITYLVVTGTAVIGAK